MMSRTARLDRREHARPVVQHVVEIGHRLLRLAEHLEPLFALVVLHELGDGGEGRVVAAEHPIDELVHARLVVVPAERPPG
jgi:hypothetical protein